MGDEEGMQQQCEGEGPTKVVRVQGGPTGAEIGITDS